MDNNNVIDINTGKITPYYMHLGAEADEAVASGGLVDDTINIPRGEYEDLLDDSVFLYFLKVAGVDSWEGWDDALEMYDEYNVEEDEE